MGLGVGLVKRVFSKSCSSISTRDEGSVRNFRADRNRWTAVRLYLCGDELSSVLAENDLASVKGSEVTVSLQLPEEDSGHEESCRANRVEEHEELQITEEEENSPTKFTQDSAAENDLASVKGSEVTVSLQLPEEDSGHEESCRANRVEEHEELQITEEEENSPTKFTQDSAATLIQSAFRGFMVRRRYKESRKSCSGGVEDPSEVNEAASIEVLASDSVENFKIQDNIAIQHLVLHKSHSQGHRLKEEWDDSIASSDTLKLRIQNRLEATTRRERALAYAFSQQLRTCTSKKKPTQSDSTGEPNTSWSWLERWMATRVPENPVEDCWSKHLDPATADRRVLAMIHKKRLDVSFEGKESCGSNDVSVNCEGGTPSAKYDRFKNKLKSTRTVSRRKTMPEYYRPLGSAKVSKKDTLKDADKDKRGNKQVQAKSAGEMRSIASQAPVDQ